MTAVATMIRATDPEPPVDALPMGSRCMPLAVSAGDARPSRHRRPRERPSRRSELVQQAAEPLPAVLPLRCVVDAHTRTEFVQIAGRHTPRAPDDAATHLPTASFRTRLGRNVGCGEIACLVGVAPPPPWTPDSSHVGVFSQATPPSSMMALFQTRDCPAGMSVPASRSNAASSSGTSKAGGTRLTFVPTTAFPVARVERQRSCGTDPHRSLRRPGCGHSRRSHRPVTGLRGVLRPVLYERVTGPEAHHVRPVGRRQCRGSWPLVQKILPRFDDATELCLLAHHLGDENFVGVVGLAAMGTRGGPPRTTRRARSGQPTGPRARLPGGPSRSTGRSYPRVARPDRAWRSLSRVRSAVRLEECRPESKAACNSDSR